MPYRGVVLDLDGTVYRGDSPIAGVPETIARLRDRGLSVLFFSNNPIKSRRAYVERLAGMGIDATEAEVLSAGTVTTSYLAEHHADDPAFVVGHPGLVEQFEAADLPVTTDPDVAELLVASYDQQFNYDDMTAAYRVAADGSPFIGTDPDVVIPTDDGIALGSGAIINAVAGVLERDPDRVLGKPSPEAVGMAGEALGVPLEDCLVVGDRLNTDLALGERASMTTVLVRTGVTTDAQLEQSALTPDFVLDSLADIEAVFD